MSIQDFIVIYNETFRYIAGTYGRARVDDLWAAISREWCWHLRRLVMEKGIAGVYEYWGGSEGTLKREKADFSITFTNGHYTSVMNHCPSVGELIERHQAIFPDYCEHCAALYAPVLAEAGIGYRKEYERDAVTGLPTGRCKAWIEKA